MEAAKGEKADPRSEGGAGLPLGGVGLSRRRGEPAVEAVHPGHGRSSSMQLR